jgi:hypothetical protein
MPPKREGTIRVAPRLTAEQANLLRQFLASCAVFRAMLVVVQGSAQWTLPQVAHWASLADLVGQIMANITAALVEDTAGGDASWLSLYPCCA